jgi:hypothetical protein
MAVSQKQSQLDGLKRWKVDQPDTPRAKWVPADPANPMWQTRPATTTPDMENLDRWLEDMYEWGLMMHDAVVDLQKRVAELEGRGK